MDSVSAAGQVAGVGVDDELCYAGTSLAIAFLRDSEVKRLPTIRSTSAGHFAHCPQTLLLNELRVRLAQLGSPFPHPVI